MTKAVIRDTVLDYFEGWFEGDVARMDRSLHPDLVKRERGTALGITTKERMLKLTDEGEGREAAAGRTLDIDVEIEDVSEDIASVTVRTAVYYEYLHLVRTPHGWKIANALWRPA